MTKQQINEALQFVSQTIPFFMITGIFIGIAYSCSPSLTPFHMGETSDLIRLSCNYLP